MGAGHVGQPSIGFAIGNAAVFKIDCKIFFVNLTVSNVIRTETVNLTENDAKAHFQAT